MVAHGVSASAVGINTATGSPGRGVIRFRFNSGARFPLSLVLGGEGRGEGPFTVARAPRPWVPVLRGVGREAGE